MWTVCTRGGNTSKKKEQAWHHIMTTLGRKTNADYRSREYLTPTEVEKLIGAAKQRGRHKTRDYALLLMMYRHGLRVSEAISLRWDAIALDDNAIYITRHKGSDSGVHPLQPDEISVLNQLKTMDYGGPYLFSGERGSLSRYAVHKLIRRCAEFAGLEIKAHPHMLRHACGHYLAMQNVNTRKIQDYLGHRDIRHTERYTKLNGNRFSDIQWEVNKKHLA